MGKKYTTTRIGRVRANMISKALHEREMRDVRFLRDQAQDQCIQLRDANRVLGERIEDLTRQLKQMDSFISGQHVTHKRQLELRERIIEMVKHEYDLISRTPPPMPNTKLTNGVGEVLGDMSAPWNSEAVERLMKQ